MEEIISFNPATIEEIGRVPVTAPEKVKEHVGNARAATASWQRLSISERAEYLMRARKFLLDNIDEFARTITIDNGKPLAESLTAEIYPVADLIHWMCKHAGRLLRDEKLPVGIMSLLMRCSRITYKPLGVVGIISPWNYPFSIPAGETVMALLAGNTVLLKPSSATPLVGKAIERMFSAARLPDGVFTHLSGNASTGEALIESNLDKIIFTGSVGAGKRVMAAASKHLTPLVLELGGKDPMIVRADADLDVATSGAVWGAFTNCGQCCASVERAYVHESIFDRFVEICVRKTLALKLGNGLDPQTDIGPLTTAEQLAKVCEHVEDALSRGATVHCGGVRPSDRAGYFFPPTVITNVDHSFACVREETFGPLLPIMPFSDDRQAIHLANDSAFGLTASIWSRDIKAARAMAHEIHTGTVMINDCVYTHALCQTPWGGIKHSGFGRSHSRFGLMELVRPLHVHTNHLQRKDMWWYKYDETVCRNFKSMARHLTGGLLSQLRALPAFMKLFTRKKL